MHGALIHTIPALYNVLLSTSLSPECYCSAWAHVSFHRLWFTFSCGPEGHSSPIQILSTRFQHWPIATDSFSLSWFYPEEYGTLQTSERGAFSSRLLVSLPPLSPPPHFSIFLRFEYKYISHLNGDEEKWCKLTALDWVKEQQGERGESGVREEVSRKDCLGSYLQLCFPFRGQMSRNPRCFCAQFIQGNQHLHYTHSAQMSRNLSKINLSLSVCTLSRAPLKHGDVWANYRWTSHVHGHKDISEPVSSPQPFIKHWQFSAIIITGREKTWLNRI